MFKLDRLLCVVAALGLLLMMPLAGRAQETTGGLQGTVKDPSGAVVPHATVAVSSASMVGTKEQDTDSSGFYRFANLPPGTYTVTVTSKGFKTFKREGLLIEVGHLPITDVTLEVGAETTVVEVSEVSPLIETTRTENLTNVTSDEIANIPHGISFQSAIQFAPMARSEPLAGGSAGMTGGAGGSLPGSAGNGLAVGFSIGGAADSESSYLVEGQDTENISGGASAANVPFEFIQEMEIKTSGIAAEYGGALGGVVNVIMKKGSNDTHGTLGLTYESDGMDGSPNASLRYDPLNANPAPPGGENLSQTYQPKKDHYRIARPSVAVGGPIVKDRLFYYVGFAPQYNSTSRSVNFAPAICTAQNLGCPDTGFGTQNFTQDSQQYFGTARLDASLSSKVRLFASWLYQYQRLQGSSLPNADPVASQAASYLNTSVFNPLTNYSHGLGFSAPNSTYNVGADINLTQRIVATTRFGYFFQNYHDFGWPVSAPLLIWEDKDLVDNTGAALPNSLIQPAGTATAPYDASYTKYNASKHHQFNQDIAFFKGGLWGTHAIKIGYQLNHLSNVINQNGNIPNVELFVGSSQNYFASTVVGGANCGLLQAAYASGNCAGQYGYAVINDFATILPQEAVDWNHALYAQDSWTVGHGLTLNLGIRVEKENLPVPNGVTPSGVAKPQSIDFSWTDKVAPRLGAAWDPTGHGKMKFFGSYGVVNDVMKLLLAQTSWGAQSYENCVYALGPDATNGFSLSDITATFVNGRACPNGPPTQGANFVGGVTPPSFIDSATGVSLIENTNFRPWEPVAPGIKPYRQHEYVAGWDYQISRDWAFEARYDRRRLDHVIEDASLADPTNFEMYTIVNPGEGVNKTIDGYANFLQSLGNVYGVQTAPGALPFAFNSNPAAPFGTCPTCPNNPKAIRNYDGVEFRVNKTMSHGWAGMFSYTYSSLWGNYTGLTTTDQIDGGITGRNSPDTTRSFDEPFYYFTDTGKSNAGPLPTDRPSTFKGNIYYSLPWKGMTTTFGIFQVAYEGSPMSSFVDLGYGGGGPIEATYIYGRGKWVNVTADPVSGALTLGTPYTRRTPWYTQTDFNVQHSFKVKEHSSLTFSSNFTNLLNQHAPVSYWEGFGSNFTPTFLFPYQIFGGAGFYNTVENGYDPQAAANAAGLLLNSKYGKPNVWQISRAIRLGIKFTF